MIKKEHPNGNPENEISIVETPEIQEFIKRFKIDRADFSIIEELSMFPKDLLIMELHNTFGGIHDLGQLNRENIREKAGSLERDIALRDDSNNDPKIESWIEIVRTVLPFFKKYGFTTTHSLIRHLEEYGT